MNYFGIVTKEKNRDIIKLWELFHIAIYNYLPSTLREQKYLRTILDVYLLQKLIW